MDNARLRAILSLRNLFYSVHWGQREYAFCANSMTQFKAELLISSNWLTGKPVFHCPNSLAFYRLSGDILIVLAFFCLNRAEREEREALIIKKDSLAVR